MVDSRILAEHFPSTQLAKTHDLTPFTSEWWHRGFPCGNEKHLVGGIEIVNDQLALLVTLPKTAPLDARQSVR